MSCDAQTCGGGRCRRQPQPGRRRCVLHGGAHGSGGQEGNANARSHGCYAADTLDERRFFGALIEQSLQLLRVTERLPGRSRRSRNCERRSA